MSTWSDFTALGQCLSVLGLVSMLTFLEPPALFFSLLVRQFRRGCSSVP